VTEDGTHPEIEKQLARARASGKSTGEFIEMYEQFLRRRGDDARTLWNLRVVQAALEWLPSDGA
jgi:hypothetical protein